MSSSILNLPLKGVYSKYGFNDGDMPDHIKGWFEDQGIRSEDVDWKSTLFNLVKAHVVPQLELEEGERFLRVHTSHNPARVWDDEGNDVYPPYNTEGAVALADLSHRVNRNLIVYNEDNLEVTESEREDNVKITKEYSLREESWDWFVVDKSDGGYVAHFNKDTFTDAKERAEDLASELNKANKPQFTVEDWFFDGDSPDGYKVVSKGGWAVAYFEQKTGPAYELAHFVADKLNSGEFNNE